MLLTSKTVVTWVVITVFAPEFYFLMAFDHYMCARTLLRELQALELRLHRGRAWSLSECFFIGMGGYCVRWNCRSDGGCRKTIHLWYYSFEHVLQEDPEIVLAALLSEEEISDRSKSDLFAKTAVIFQIGYYCVAVFARWAAGLFVTPLEVATLAFAACSVFSYGVLWHKPRAVSISHPLIQYDNETPRKLRDVLQGDDDTGTLSDPIVNDAPAWTHGSPALHGTSGILLMALVSALFGAIHLAAWNSQFPTPVEQLVWRVAGLTSTLILLVLWTYGYLTARDLTTRCGNALGFPIVWTCTALYVVARLVLIVEMFRSLAYLPPDAYRATWTASIPHLG